MLIRPQKASTFLAPPAHKIIQKELSTPPPDILNCLMDHSRCGRWTSFIYPISLIQVCLGNNLCFPLGQSLSMLPSYMSLHCLILWGVEGASSLPGKPLLSSIVTGEPVWSNIKARKCYLAGSIAFSLVILGTQLNKPTALSKRNWQNLC